MGNYINQRLLRPVHDWLMTVLSSLPMDGTFNQTAPLRRLKGEKCAYSFDLTAATDRVPLYLLFSVIEMLFGRAYASAVVNSALATNSFEVPFVKGRRANYSGHPLGVKSCVSFVTGQPLLFLMNGPCLLWRKTCLCGCALIRSTQV